MDSFDAIAHKLLDEMLLMEARLTEKIVGRCDSVERRVDVQCDELHSHFTARYYTTQQQVEPVFNEGPIFDVEPVFEGESFLSTTDYIDGKRMVDAAERQDVEATSQVGCALIEDAAARIVDEYQPPLQLSPDPTSSSPATKATYHLNEQADFCKGTVELVQIRFEEMPSASVRGKDALLHELHTCVRDGDVGAVDIYDMAGVGKNAFLKGVSEGSNVFESGLIAKTNRGRLYVYEVNLLDDHLVDVLLDSAAPVWNTVERNSIFISHPARFILIPLEIFHVCGMMRPMPWPSFTSRINCCMNLDAHFVWKPPWLLQRYIRASITLHELITWLGYELTEDLVQQKCGDNCGQLLLEEKYELDIIKGGLDAYGAASIISHVLDSFDAFLQSSVRVWWSGIHNFHGSCWKFCCRKLVQPWDPEKFFYQGCIRIISHPGRFILLSSSTHNLEEPFSEMFSQGTCEESAVVPKPTEQLLMVLSSSAWSGTETATTWRLPGQIQHQDILVLVDSRSSHTSICDKCFPLLSDVQPLKCCLNVKVANGPYQGTSVCL